MFCPRCHYPEIYTEGCEIYCSNCFYHFNGAERKEFRLWRKDNKIKKLIPPNCEITIRDQKQARQQNRAMNERRSRKKSDPNNEYGKKYYQDNKEKISEYYKERSKENYKENSEEIKEKRRKKYRDTGK